MTQGEQCGDPFEPPCGRDLYCDEDASPAMCAPVHDAGASCEADDQCRGECTVMWARPMCDATPTAGGAICDGM